MSVNGSDLQPYAVDLSGKDDLRSLEILLAIFDDRIGVVRIDGYPSPASKEFERLPDAVQNAQRYLTEIAERQVSGSRRKDVLMGIQINPKNQTEMEAFKRFALHSIDAEVFELTSDLILISISDGGEITAWMTEAEASEFVERTSASCSKLPSARWRRISRWKFRRK
jgi:hypothetical protein